MVILSRDRLAAASLSPISTPSAAAICSSQQNYWFRDPLYFLFTLRLFVCGDRLSYVLFVVCSAIRSHTASMVYLLSNLSKIPSHPMRKKSKLGFNLKHLISGSQTITFGFPPYFGRFASMSPKVLDTDRRPGNTLRGPWTYKSFSSGFAAALANVCVLQILPPAA